jgi:osmoprotectant transport system substrate-binding protein
VTVASFNFPESEVLAQIYGGALREAGYPVVVLPGLGPRELLEPALSRGLIDLVPEYAGSALDFLTIGRGHSRFGIASTHRALDRALESRGLVALGPALAQDSNAIVVTRATSKRYGLRTISDLAGVAPRLTFGGPPECPQRELCLLGLRRTYGLRFKAPFFALDTGGPLTLQALRAGDIDVALLFSTDPGIEKYHLVVLADDRGLQPAENVTPVIRSQTLTRFGPHLRQVLDTVSARLTTETVRTLNGEVLRRGVRPEAVAARWLAAQGLA